MTNPPVGVPTCYRHPDRETWIRCQRCDTPICPDCMRDAAVGFQCPSCVAEGRKSVRQAKTAYGGVISANPGATSITLIGINVLVWIAIMASGYRDSRLTSWLSLHAASFCQDGDRVLITSRTACEAGFSATWVPGLDDGAWWQVLTASFTHVEPWHILMNMFALWSLGPVVERFLGRARFVALYLVAALGSAFAVYAFAGAYTETVGASGAIFGLLAASLVAAWRIGADLSVFRTTLILAVVISIVPGVSWQGHLGGFVAGGLAAGVLVLAPREQRTVVQVAGLGLIAAICLGGIALMMAGA
ncbi:rhomboid family intramembrane serine protease [Nocardioides sp. LML1-1-1.1]|uniref:rhomboid family intramembrane serine protease n=1 Tax=Nocardioides sp. LML1-1-1.1 TaxID=3135248 RepID=UPI00341F7A02